MVRTTGGGENEQSITRGREIRCKSVETFMERDDVEALVHDCFHDLPYGLEESDSAVPLAAF